MAGGQIAKKEVILKKLENLLCDLENQGRGPKPRPEPAVDVCSEVCQCKPPPDLSGSIVVPRYTIDGKPGVSGFKRTLSNVVWSPSLSSGRPPLSRAMTCYARTVSRRKSDTGMAKGDKDFCTQPDSTPCPENLTWLPNVSGRCLFPTTCKANCFDHRENHDWNNVHPSYTYHRQRRDFRPF